MSAKSGKLNIGNRQIKPARKIEETHAQATPKAEVKAAGEAKAKGEKKERVSRVKRVSKGKSIVTSIRFKEDELEQINKYLEKKRISLSELLREALHEKGVLK
jgi:predicted  nucleic acid-binding Zn-ribbon protein